FDEPTRGLDPVQIVEMRNLIHDLKQQHTVLISSHILTEISQTCDRLLVLGLGRLIGQGTEQELSQKQTKIFQVTITVRTPEKLPDPYRGDAKTTDEPKPEEIRAAVAKVLSGIDGVTSVSAPFVQKDTMTYAL